MGTISKNFSYAEFEASPTAKAKHIINVITTFEIRDAVKALTLSVLQPLRDIYGKRMPISSGFRCPELNAAVGGVPGSQHKKGEAADVETGNQTESYRLARLAKTHPEIFREIDQMILYPTFVHFSHKRVGVQRNQILYNKSYKGRRV
ncbi:MAG: peptidase M15 [Bacteroidales bacterium]|nr:peptidase M15 [Bacteroidales bacterium]